MNILVIGAHPDDCECFAGGSALKFVENGHTVKFVSVTNGDAGHHEMKPEALAETRRLEIEAADSYLGVQWEILDNHDGRLEADINVREELIRIIRRFKADVVMTHRPWDYHPDHRNTATLVQDTAYMVIVPNVCPDVPALEKNPVYLYLWDECDDPIQFRPDVIVPIDDVFDKKLRAFHLMPSQFYEWLPFTFGTLDTVPDGEDARLKWLDCVVREWMKNPYPEETLRRLGQGISLIEAFQVCPFGRRPSRDELNVIFSFVPESAIRFD